jgi:signal transduction histidine kinase
MAAKVAEKFALKNSPHSWRFWSNGPTLERSMRRTGPAAAVSLSPADVLAADAAPARLPYPRGTTFLVILAVAAISVGAEIALIKGPTGTLSVGICAMALAMGMTAAASARHRRAIAAAITQERHRIAREIHDGLAQELAYIRMEVLRMAAKGNDERVNRLALAAERALEESRGAIATLRREHDSSFSRELTEVAEELTDRAGARLSLRLQPGLEIQPERRQALVRILREAITNGVRHGQATEVALELSGGDGVRMAVRDNGGGFTPGGPRPSGGFGLTTMRERAQAMGGDLTIQSDPGHGTLVEVNLP